MRLSDSRSAFREQACQQFVFPEKCDAFDSSGLLRLMSRVRWRLFTRS